MKNFYVFLDIDGVLNHYKWIKFVCDMQLENLGFSRSICPNNVKILSRFLKEIEKTGMEPVIVVSSCWRLQHKHKLITLLNQNHIQYHGKYLITDKDFIRGRSIKKFMEQNGIKNNFVVIDDETSDILPYLPKEHLMKASGIFANGLTNKNVNAFIPKLQEFSSDEKTL